MKKTIVVVTGLFIAVNCHAWNFGSGFNEEELKLLKKSSLWAEMDADPGIPASNEIRLYTKDNGSGVTTFYTRDSTGTVSALGIGSLSTFMTDMNSTSFADDQVFVADDASNGTARTVTNCTGASEALRYTQATNSFSCGTISATNGWSYSTPNVTLTTSTDNVGIGGAPLGKLSVDGDTDETQALIQFHSTQTALGVVFENSAGTDLFTWANDGTYTQAGTATPSMSVGGGTPATYPITFNLSGASDPVLTAVDTGYRWAAASEDITEAFSANTRTYSSTTGVNSAVFSSIDLTTPVVTLSGTPNAAGEIGYNSTRAMQTTYGGITAVAAPIHGTIASGVGTQTLINSVTTDQDFTSMYTFPANSIYTNKVYRVTIFSELVSTATALTVGTYLKIGTTKVYTTVANDPQDNRTCSIAFVFYIFGRDAAGASANVSTTLVSSNLSDSSVLDQNTTNQPVALATNGTLTISFGVIWSAIGSADTLEQQGFIIEELN